MNFQSKKHKYFSFPYIEIPFLFYSRMCGGDKKARRRGEGKEGRRGESDEERRRNRGEGVKEEMRRNLL